MSSMDAPSWDASAGKDADQRPGLTSERTSTDTGFRYPIGVEMIEGENYTQREGYDVIYLKDEDTPRYQYTLAVSADRAGKVFVRLLALLPDEIRAVLEVPGPDEPAREVCDVWMSHAIEKEKFARAFREHQRLFIHDGMVGFGAVSGDGLTELFIDEHKLIYFYAPDMDRVDHVLASLGLPARNIVRHFSELGHVHVSLSGKDAGEAYWEVADELKGSLGLDWEESKEYT
jgi:hypothetical protein